MAKTLTSPVIPQKGKAVPMIETLPPLELYRVFCRWADRTDNYFMNQDVPNEGKYKSKYNIKNFCRETQDQYLNAWKAAGLYVMDPSIAHDVRAGRSLQVIQRLNEAIEYFDAKVYPLIKLDLPKHRELLDAYQRLIELRSCHNDKLMDSSRERKKVANPPASDVIFDTVESSTHRCLVILNQIKAEAGIEPLKTAVEHQKEGRSKRYQAYYSLSPRTKSKSNPFRMPTESELRTVSQLLNDFPLAKQIAESRLAAYR